MITTNLPTTACPSCGAVLDAATSMSDDNTEPTDGDITICMKCGHIMVFEDNRPRNPTNAEMRIIAGNRRIIAVQKARGKIVQ